MDDRYFNYAQERHQELLNIARNGRLIMSAKPARIGLWDDILIASGDLLITLGKKLKDRPFVRSETIDYSIDPCTEVS